MKRLIQAIGLGAFTFTMSPLPGAPSANNAIPMRRLPVVPAAQADPRRAHGITHDGGTDACEG
jgi:hypothetical protein